MRYDDEDRPDLLSRPILSITADDFPECPECGRRMDTVMVKVSGTWMPKSVGSDDDGPIFEARCRDHGPFRFQVEELAPEDDFEDYDHDHALDTWHGEGGPDYA